MDFTEKDYADFAHNIGCLSPERRSKLLPNDIHNEADKKIHKAGQKETFLFFSACISAGLTTFAFCLANESKSTSLLKWLPMAILFIITAIILSILIYADQQYQNAIGKSKDVFDVDKTFNELKLETRLKNPNIIKNEKERLQTVYYYIKIAYECHNEKAIQDTINQHTKLSALAYGLTEMEELGDTSDKRIKNVYDAYLNELTGFSKNLLNKIKPALNKSIGKVIEQDQLGLLPKSMHNQAIEILSKQLLEN